MTTVVLLVLTVSSSSDTTLAGNALQTREDQGRQSILRKLDFTKSAFRIHTQPGLENRLEKRALARLKRAGLEPVDWKHKGPVEAVLVLTINPIPIDEDCPQKVLYDSKLQLMDDMILKRDPEMELEVITWSYAPGHPSVVDRMSVEKLEAEVDRYINQFIVSYGLVLPRQ